MIVGRVDERNFRCSSRLFTQQQITNCSRIPLSLVNKQSEFSSEISRLTIEKGELSLEILGLVGAHRELSFEHSGGIKQ